MSRVHNFTAGPAVLPLSVVKELQETLPEYGNTGLGLMEMSHRSSPFQELHDRAKSLLRNLLNIPEEYTVLFLQGGASLQFYMAPINLLSPEDTAAYILTGTWSEKALKEAKRCSLSRECWKPEGTHTRVPRQNEYHVSDDAVYLHYTSNNTIYGTQFHEIPNVENGHLVADMSSDICSRNIDVSKHDLIYAGAQKNLGPSGITIIILSPWAVEQSRRNNRKGGIPSMLNYALMKDKDSLFNTPNTFGIFALERMLSWLTDLGGVAAIEKQNQIKAQKIYDALAHPMWSLHAEKESRSLMNITWRGPTEELESLFIKEAEKEGLKGLKGHRSVGGIRASIYNACPTSSVEALVSFIESFSRAHE